MANTLAIIADDLTGANDTGVQFAKQGLNAVVLMNTTDLGEMTATDVVVLDTNSRALPAAEAYLKTAEAAKIVQQGCFDAVYKKVDSTLRGNLAVEIDAIMDVCGQEVAIVAPAFPKNGRYTIGGYHIINSTPLEATEISRDPRCPVKESYVPTLLKQHSRRNVGHISLKTVLQGEKAIVTEIEGLVAANQKIIVFDVWQDEQFKVIAASAVKTGKKILWVGSAGLAEYLPPLLGMSAIGKGNYSH